MNVGINPKGAQQILELFSRDDITLNYATATKGFRNIINRYYNVYSYPVSAYNDGDSCQINAIVIIGDGAFTDSGQGISNTTLTVIERLAAKNPPVLTFAVGYGSDVINNNRARRDFTNIALKGGTQTATTQRGIFC